MNTRGVALIALLLAPLGGCSLVFDGGEHTGGTTGDSGTPDSAPPSDAMPPDAMPLPDGGVCSALPTDRVMNWADCGGAGCLICVAGEAFDHDIGGASAETVVFDMDVAAWASGAIPTMSVGATFVREDALAPGMVSASTITFDPRTSTLTAGATVNLAGAAGLDEAFFIALRATPTGTVYATLAGFGASGPGVWLGAVGGGLAQAGGDVEAITFNTGSGVVRHGWSGLEGLGSPTAIVASASASDSILRMVEPRLGPEARGSTGALAVLGGQLPDSVLLWDAEMGGALLPWSTPGRTGPSALAWGGDEFYVLAWQVGREVRLQALSCAPSLAGVECCPAKDEVSFTALGNVQVLDLVPLHGGGYALPYVVESGADTRLMVRFFTADLGEAMTGSPAPDLELGRFLGETAYEVEAAVDGSGAMAPSFLAIGVALGDSVEARRVSASAVMLGCGMPPAM